MSSMSTSQNAVEEPFWPWRERHQRWLRAKSQRPNIILLMTDDPALGRHCRARATPCFRRPM